MKSLIVRPEVDADLVRYWRHIAKDNIDAADRFLVAVRACENAVAQAPSIGRLRRWRDPRLAGVRTRPLARPFNAWLVFYRERPEAVEILRVLHGMMDLESKLTSRPEETGD